MKKLTSSFLITLLCGSLIAMPASSAPLPVASADASDEAYNRAIAAIDAQRWDDAINAFRKLAADGGAKGDRALYWLAYAQAKDGRTADALTTIQQLHQKYPKSRWNDDARALEIDVRQAAGQQVAPESLPDDDLKLLAITSLLDSDDDRAVSLLEKVLRSKNSDETKERALFVLSQSKSPRAAQLIESVARGGAGEELQLEALQMLGTHRSPQNRTLLGDVFRKATSEDVKEAALQGMMISGDHETILSVASTDKDPEMRAKAAQMLGVMKATADLDRLYRSETSSDVKEEILQGMMIAGDVTRLSDLARTERDPELRVAAIHLLGAMGKKSGDVLQQLWNSERDPDVKEAIIDGLFIQGNATTLIDLAKREQNREMKHAIIEKLAVMNSKEAREYVLQFLND